jgi:pantetheine-phosphate adenylyltransferase
LKNVIAIYPGSFDPLTNGHLDLIERGSKIFDRLIVAILQNAEKEPLFTLAERLAMLREMTHHLPNVEIDTFDGLLVDYAKKRGASAVLRGIRAISDYEYELQMALMNRKLSAELETVFMMPAEAYSYVSSRLVKQIIRLGGSVRGLVPPSVEERVRRRVLETPKPVGPQVVAKTVSVKSTAKQPGPAKRAAVGARIPPKGKRR